MVKGDFFIKFCIDDCIRKCGRKKNNSINNSTIPYYSDTVESSEVIVNKGEYMFERVFHERLLISFVLEVEVTKICKEGECRRRRDDSDIDSTRVCEGSEDIHISKA